MIRRRLPILALVLAACGESPSAPSQDETAVAGQGMSAAGAESFRHCVAYPRLDGYDAIVQWSRTPVTEVSLRADGISHHVVLPRRQREGQVTVRVSFIPTGAALFARAKLSGFAACTYVSS